MAEKEGGNLGGPYSEIWEAFAVQAQTKRSQKTSLKPMTHAPETDAINQLYFFLRRFLARVSCLSGMEFVWYQVLAPIRTLFHSKPYIAGLIERGPSGRDVMGPLPSLALLILFSSFPTPLTSLPHFPLGSPSLSQAKGSGGSAESYPCESRPPNALWCIMS